MARFSDGNGKVSLRQATELSEQLFSHNVTLNHLVHSPLPLDRLIGSRKFCWFMWVLTFCRLCHPFLQPVTEHPMARIVILCNPAPKLLKPFPCLWRGSRRIIPYSQLNGLTLPAIKVENVTSPVRERLTCRLDVLGNTFVLSRRLTVSDIDKRQVHSFCVFAKAYINPVN